MKNAANPLQVMPCNGIHYTRTADELIAQELRSVELEREDVSFPRVFDWNHIGENSHQMLVSVVDTLSLTKGLMALYI